MQCIQNIDATALRLALAAELHGHEGARYLQRLEAVLLVSAGNRCSFVAAWLDLSARTVERWVRAYQAAGVAGLHEAARQGRRPRLSPLQNPAFMGDVRAAPAALGYRHNNWSGKLLSLHLQQHYGLVLSSRQCQRLLRAVAPDRARDSRYGVRAAGGAGAAPGQRPPVRRL